MKVKQGRHSLPDISVFSAGPRIWTLPGGVKKGFLLVGRLSKIWKEFRRLAEEKVR